MDMQTIINYLIGATGACVVWWVNTIWGMAKTLQQDVSNLHIELAKNYAPRAELQNTLERIFDKLDELQKEMREGK